MNYQKSLYEYNVALATLKKQLISYRSGDIYVEEVFSHDYNSSEFNPIPWLVRSI
jgi:hypothetical protein